MKFSRLISTLVVTILVAALAVFPAYADKPNPDPPTPKENNGNSHQGGQGSENGNAPVSGSSTNTFGTAGGGTMVSSSNWWYHSSPNARQEMTRYSGGVEFFNAAGDPVDQTIWSIFYHFVYSPNGTRFVNAWSTGDYVNTTSCRTVYNNGQVVHSACHGK